MTDEKLADLFAEEGSAPERDAAFVRQTDLRIGRARLGLRLVRMALPALLILIVAAGLFGAARVFEPELAQVIAAAPEIMGVPLPMVIGALGAGLVVHYRRLFRFRSG